MGAENALKLATGCGGRAEPACALATVVLPQGSGGGGGPRDPSEPISGSWGGCCGERSVLQWPDPEGQLPWSHPEVVPAQSTETRVPAGLRPAVSPSLSLSPLPSHGNPSSCLTQHQLPGRPPESGAEGDRCSRKGMPARPSLQAPTRRRLWNPPGPCRVQESQFDSQPGKGLSFLLGGVLHTLGEAGIHSSPEAGWRVTWLRAKSPSPRAAAS